MAARKDENLKRIPVTLNLSNKEDREVYEILSKKGNRNYYIRQAVLHFHKGARLDLQTAEDIKNVVADAIRENIALVASEQKKSTKQKRAVSKATPKETKKLEVEESVEAQETETVDEDNLDLSGIEDLF